MHFYYIDESGDTGTNLEDAHQPIFVMGGISVRDEGWNTTHERFMKVISDYFDGNVPAGFELHANDLLGLNGSGAFTGHNSERRYDFGMSIIDLLIERKHGTHFYAIDKSKLNTKSLDIPLTFDAKVPYVLAFDYMITYINRDIQRNRGQSARGMIILDEKDQFTHQVESIMRERRYGGSKANRVKLITEFSYPVDSRNNPMVQMSDLIIYCVKRFLEIENGYREHWSSDAKEFYARCYGKIAGKAAWQGVVDRKGQGMQKLNEYLEHAQAKPKSQWKSRYGLA